MIFSAVQESVRPFLFLFLFLRVGKYETVNLNKQVNKRYKNYKIVQTIYSNAPRHGSLNHSIKNSVHNRSQPRKAYADAKVPALAELHGAQRRDDGAAYGQHYISEGVDVVADIRISLYKAKRIERRPARAA